MSSLLSLLCSSSLAGKDKTKLALQVSRPGGGAYLPASCRPQCLDALTHPDHNINTSFVLKILDPDCSESKIIEGAIKLKTHSMCPKLQSCPHGSNMSAAKPPAEGALV